MGKHRHDWPEAKKLCRLNQNDIAMAKKLGFGPDSLVRARPDPKQKWKLPVKYWIHELHFKRFGYVLGEQPLPAAPPPTPEVDEEAVRQYGEQVYWEDYWDRNRDDGPGRRQADNPNKAATTTPGRRQAVNPNKAATTTPGKRQAVNSKKAATAPPDAGTNGIEISDDVPF